MTLTYHPGEANLRSADVVVINKIDTAGHGNVAIVRRNIRAVNPNAVVIEAASPIFVEDPNAIVGKDVLVIEDGPTLTHGEMAYGAGVVAAQSLRRGQHHRPAALRGRHDCRDVSQSTPNTGAVLPAMGYGGQQVADLAETINNTPCDLVIIATPIDLRRVVEINRPTQRVRYELQEIGQPSLADVLGAVREEDVTQPLSDKRDLVS